MKKLILLLMLVPAVSFAGQKNCSLGDKIISGFALTAGFRWDMECPEPGVCAPAPTGNHDPAFVGAELRVPISARTVLGGNFDRDWTEAPEWNARVYLAFSPWKRAR